jgi:hypothetical protein
VVVRRVGRQSICGARSVIVRPSSASAQAVLVDLESHAEVLDGFGFRLWVVGGGKLRMNRLEFS